MLRILNTSFHCISDFKQALASGLISSQGVVTSTSVGYRNLAHLLFSRCGKDLVIHDIRSRRSKSGNKRSRFSMGDHCMVTAGEWTSGDSRWNFAIDKKIMSRIVPVFPGMPLIELQSNVINEFFTVRLRHLRCF
ncbi:hypothetical protein DY000_02060823 [Brassica cretica]|uniref:Uncharacterized protein n=1 Tax=Brassica cretica TaxID=69181 RepID=A0ABQ7AVS4_BRACR|nr:hypothetical protein DY000_02060823 [Brassica cretica]